MLVCVTAEVEALTVGWAFGPIEWMFRFPLVNLAWGRKSSAALWCWLMPEVPSTWIYASWMMLNLAQCLSVSATSSAT